MSFPLDLAGLLILLVVGLMIIVFIAKVLFFLLPAAIVALVVWFLTGSGFWAGIAFLIIAALSIAKRKS
ncbi:MAG: hypothetical protein AOA65_0770 [Candidatus Bathyarchaeota archaeon BA1]|nr:MAG: hypothetical protein AOA65_0770 [Candidatus Bathyarchaeota archaeon BA1]